MLHDAFISHASEDKDAFVRPLANALRAQNVAVWFDEFELKVGSSLRRSIDLGLSRSRFGILILSKAFFGRRWPEWELDGLVQRQMSASEPVLLPIWLDVTYEDVLGFSPSLADKYALRAEQGLDRIVPQLLEVIKPQGSSLVVARDRLVELGYDPPVVTDDWWHNAIEKCASHPMDEHWGFPLPSGGQTAQERGERIAWAALQLHWQKNSAFERMTQITRPGEVHDFIGRMPGLAEACFEYPDYLASYVPQLTLPGFGGIFEEVFNSWLHHSRMVQEKERQSGSSTGRALTVDGHVPLCDLPIALHDPSLGNYQPDVLACLFVQGELMGPPVKVYDYIDYALWLLSHASKWLPAGVRGFLLTGMKEWAVWPWSGYENDSDFPRNNSTGSLQNDLMRSKGYSTFKLSKKGRRDLNNRVEHSINILQLPEEVSVLSELFLTNGFVQAWFRRRGRQKRST